MIRNGSLEEISDGKLYGINDLVKADTAGCSGCPTKCCYGMGDTIVLDPYDVYRLGNYLGQTFEQLLIDKIAINKVDDILLPNLKMDEKTGGCAFLNEEERCTVHAARPAVCRLFPLGRYWADGDTFHYILQTGQCRKNNLSKIKVKKWIDCDNIKEYDEYVVLWHKYIKRTGRAVNECMRTSDSELAATQVKTICMYTLKTFYMTAYNKDRDFFVQFKERLKSAYDALGLN